MRTPVIWIASTAITLGLIAAGTTVVLAARSAPAPAATDSSASGSDDGAARSPSPASSAAPSSSPSDFEAAAEAALDASGPGTVIEADLDDNAAYAYEIDIRLDAGGTVEVTLDSAMNVVSTEVDDGDGRGSDVSGSDDHGSDDD
jgi:uncharacterized membrane protein YkoI